MFRIPKEFAGDLSRLLSVPMLVLLVVMGTIPLIFPLAARVYCPVADGVTAPAHAQGTTQGTAHDRN